MSRYVFHSGDRAGPIWVHFTTGPQLIAVVWTPCHVATRRHPRRHGETADTPSVRTECTTNTARERRRPTSRGPLRRPGVVAHDGRSMQKGRSRGMQRQASYGVVPKHSGLVLGFPCFLYIDTDLYVVCDLRVLVVAPCLQLILKEYSNID